MSARTTQLILVKPELSYEPGMGNMQRILQLLAAYRGTLAPTDIVLLPEHTVTDFWFSDVFVRAQALPDLVLVPAHSVSRKPDPDYSRALWRHLSVARAYEFGVYVGVSDWAHVRVPGMLAPSGVSGFADPTTVHADELFTPVAHNNAQVFELDREKLLAFRADRLARGFFWKNA